MYETLRHKSHTVHVTSFCGGTDSRLLFTDAFLVYLGVGVLAFVCIFFGQPETQGIRLEDMDSIFDKKPWSKSQTTKRPSRENGQVDSAP